MRIIQLMTVLLLAGAGAVSAQAKKGTLATAKINLPTVQCEECSQKIERFVGHEEGVQSLKVDWKHKTATVKYFTDRTNIENVKTAIANTGFDADNVTADKEAYDKLPLCCKKPEDGGGMPDKKH
ncbi:Copper chaperone CopZ [Chitinophaga costaii]|uniref:Copper chaperone CopZ n=1 Tax=Chitinophaga costaii TaxID=1335309 RepID=A0A1C4E631_9BACT|nr:heavy metal-associated domain-containing protein [Chitinophaga costaii]PUZ24303.1 heavy metal transporter [Chitinophaga costaii]SCC39010.1 Copper chaperone CopZ [Chitinophaga costaii]